MNNKKFFKSSEANNWFQENYAHLEKKGESKPISLLVDWLTPFKDEIENILELGCGTGHKIVELTKKLKSKGFGVDPSSDAVEYISKNFPNINIELGFGDKIPFDKKFDLVHLGFYLYLVDREYYLSCISEADKSVKDGGFLSIIDFETPFPYSKKYKDKDNVFSHKQNNSDVFVSSGLYTIINKFHFSRKNFFFDKNIDERVSLTLLYKENKIFK